MGLILSYFILPETENRTLEEIEMHFSDNTKGLADWKIAKSSKRNQVGLDNKGYDTTESSKV